MVSIGLVYSIHDPTEVALNKMIEAKRLLKVKARQKEEAINIEDTERLVTEIEMLKVVLYLMSRNMSQ